MVVTENASVEYWPIIEKVGNLEKMRLASASSKEVFTAIQLVLNLYQCSVFIFPENKSHQSDSFPKELNSIISFQPLHSYHLEITKLLNDDFVNITTFLLLFT